ncbi:MAG: ABC transporter permease, partial [Balneolaceae bacterium]
MLKNYFKIALRNLIKNKSHTFINVGGLSLGIVSALVIFLIIQYDLSFDKWHADSDLIYRIVREDSEFGNISYDTGGPYPLAEAVENDITGIEFVSLVDNNSASTPVVSYFENGEIQNKLKEENFAYIEPDFFNILTYQWVLGDKESALSRPNTAVITESFAEKMFGSFDVLGREMTINFGTAIELEITGLIKDQPKNSDFPLVLFIESTSKDVNGDSRGGSWTGTSSSLQTYVKLLPGISPESVNAQFDPLIAKYRNEDRAEVMEFFLQPLSQIHFESEFGNYSGRIVEKKVLFALGIIGFLLIITACINFINLNTAIAVSRSKEVGLRKTLGSSKIQLTLLF